MRSISELPLSYPRNCCLYNVQIIPDTAGCQPRCSHIARVWLRLLESSGFAAKRFQLQCLNVRRWRLVLLYNDNTVTFTPRACCFGVITVTPKVLAGKITSQRSAIRHRSIRHLTNDEGEREQPAYLYSSLRIGMTGAYLVLKSVALFFRRRLPARVAEV
jgi:hypothetical protein